MHYPSASTCVFYPDPDVTVFTPVCVTDSCVSVEWRSRSLHLVVIELQWSEGIRNLNCSLDSNSMLNVLPAGVWEIFHHGAFISERWPTTLSKIQMSLLFVQWTNANFEYEFVSSFRDYSKGSQTLVSWLITRFRNRVPGCWNRVTRIRLYSIFCFLNSRLLNWFSLLAPNVVGLGLHFPYAECDSGYI